MGNTKYNANNEYNTAAVRTSRQNDPCTHTSCQKQQHEHHQASDQHHDANILLQTWRGSDAKHAKYANIFLQLETHPITEEQLVNKVCGIYADLVMVKKKCIEIDKQLSQQQNELSDV